jgi:hypothetical protein
MLVGNAYMTNKVFTTLAAPSSIEIIAHLPADHHRRWRLDNGCLIAHGIACANSNVRMNASLCKHTALQLQVDKDAASSLFSGFDGRTWQEKR